MFTSRRELPLVLLAVLVASPALAGVSEQWYLLRARSNVEIGNFKAAIEAYRKVLDKDPDHEEALRGLGAACEANGELDEAIAVYDRYLSRHKNADIAFRQARFLSWSRYAYRRTDAAKYLKMGLAERDDPAQRIALARLLAADKATLDDALTEYRTLVRARPSDSALRSEYLKLLLWDERHLDEAIDEMDRLRRENPNNSSLALEHARLLARHPRRTTEAADAYRALVEASPNNRTLRLQYAKVLARDPDRAKEARAQLELAAEGRWDYESRVLYADLLAGESDERPEALRRYRELLNESPKNTAVRLKYARLLGAEKESAGDAITQYERVLASEPKNAEAHAGIARMYAWRGDNDRAQYHDRLALLYGARDGSAGRISRDLSVGREPRSGAGISAIIQPSGAYGLYALRVPLHARAEVTTFSTTTADVGFESFWSGSGQNAFGLHVDAGAELRVSREEAVKLELGYQTARGGIEGLRGRASFEFRPGSMRLRPHVDRQPREDSFEALVGTSSSGAASSNLAGFHLSSQHESFGWWLDPGVGFASSRGASANFMATLDGGAELRAWDAARWTVLVGIDTKVAHHAFDASAAELGGYFSPALLASATPSATVMYRLGHRATAELAAGPSIQLQALHGGSATVVPGGRARAYVRLRPADRLELQVGASAARVGDAYVRGEALGTLSYLF